MSGAEMSDASLVHAESVQQWRDWLLEHHALERSAWLVSWRKGTGRSALTYDEAVCEALAVGWVDSLPRKLDDERTMLYFAARKPTSAWSRPNKERVERLRAEHRMLPAGEAVVQAAIENGAWSKLDEVENLTVPSDLSEAFDRHPGARANWDAFPRSARRGILEWILQAKRAQTRTNRIEETARLAARGERAAQWGRR